jgi:manganese-dependent ADP-ribose/CDP-alcohol diphosphatase
MRKAMYKQKRKIRSYLLIIIICLFSIYSCELKKDRSETDLILKIGLVADPQYENKEPAGIRYYKESLWKLAEAIDTFNYYKVDFVQTLGDVINGQWESFDSILPVYMHLNKSIVDYHLFGNHEFAVEKQFLPLLTEKLHMPANYYSYVKKGWRFIVLDATDYSAVSLPLHPEHELQLAEYYKSAIHSNNRDWNGAIGPEQQAWLKTRLDSSQLNKEKVILYCHMPVNSNIDTASNLINDYQIISLIAKYPSVVAFIDGHNHKGDLVTENNIQYITLKGMVDTQENSFTIMKIFKNHIQLKGFGNQKDINFDLKN